MGEGMRTSATCVSDLSPDCAQRRSRNEDRRAHANHRIRQQTHHARQTHGRARTRKNVHMHTRARTHTPPPMRLTFPGNR